MTHPYIDFWFEFGSTYSYLSVMRIDELAAARGVAVRWQPFLLGPIFKSLGWNSSPFVIQKQKGEYMWRDVERQAVSYGLPWRKPSVFPRLTLLPMRIASLNADEPWVSAFCRAVMHAGFACDADISSEPVVRELLERLGLPAGPLIAAAQSDAGKARLRERTDEAVALGVFGAPTFMVRGEMFWGDDRLERALTHAGSR